jgi:hypothetical protein
MTGSSLSFLILGIAEVVWLWVAGALAVVFRPRRPRPGPMTSELRDESPAVVNLLTHDWRTTPSAVPATVLDLAVRGVIEIVQVSPERDLVEVRRRGQDVPNLLAYERQVLDHVRRAAVDGVVPAAALTTGPATASEGWWRRFHRSVAFDARARGLARRRYPAAVHVGLGIGVALLALWLYLAADAADNTANGDGPAPWLVVAAVVGFIACARAVLRFDRYRQRDTDEGLAAASHWLGVRRGYSEGRYAELPPAAVVLYERHLAYAAAMDVASRAIAGLPLGAEDDRVAWSHRDGQWRQLIVSYPRRFGWGQSPGRAALGGLFWTATLIIPIYVAHHFGSRLLGDLQDVARNVGSVKDPSSRLYDATVADRIGLAATWVVAIVLVLVALNAVYRGVFRFVRGLADLSGTARHSGPVVRRRTWPSSHAGERVDVNWVAVDEGTSDRIRAVVVRPAMALRINQGDEVELQATRYLGFVKTIRVLQAAAPLPPPVRLDELPGPTPLPPVHWSERPGAPGVGELALTEDERPAGTGALTAALARQLEKLIAERNGKRP